MKNHCNISILYFYFDSKTNSFYGYILSKKRYNYFEEKDQYMPVQIEKSFKLCPNAE